MSSFYTFFIASVYSAVFFFRRYLTIYVKELKDTYIELAYVIIKGNCEIGDETRKHKTMEGIRINKDAQTDKNGKNREIPH